MLVEHLLDFDAGIDGLVLLERPDADRASARAVEYDAQLGVGQRRNDVADRRIVGNAPAEMCPTGAALIDFAHEIDVGDGTAALFLAVGRVLN